MSPEQDDTVQQLSIAGVTFINLDERTDRLQHIQKVLMACPWPQSRLSATKYVTIPDDMRLRMKSGLGGTLAVAAIWTSHLRALNEFAANPEDGNFILLEDDVHIAGDFWADLSTQLSALPQNWEIVLISPRYRSRIPSETGKKIFVAPPQGEGPNDLSAVVKDFYCTGAHFCLFRDKAVVRKVSEVMENAPEIYDADVFYASNFRSFGISDKRVTAGGFGSDHV